MSIESMVEGRAPSAKPVPERKESGWKITLTMLCAAAILSWISELQTAPFRPVLEEWAQAELEFGDFQNEIQSLSRTQADHRKLLSELNTIKEKMKSLSFSTNWDQFLPVDASVAVLFVEIGVAIHSLEQIETLDYASPRAYRITKLVKKRLGEYDLPRQASDSYARLAMEDRFGKDLIRGAKEAWIIRLIPIFLPLFLGLILWLFS